MKIDVTYEKCVLTLKIGNTVILEEFVKGLLITKPFTVTMEELSNVQFVPNKEIVFSEDRSPWIEEIRYFLSIDEKNSHYTISSGNWHFSDMNGGIPWGFIVKKIKDGSTYILDVKDEEQRKMSGSLLQRFVIITRLAAYYRQMED